MMRSALREAVLPQLVQFVFRVDADDVVSVPAIDAAATGLNAYVSIIVGERYGYRNMARYYNECAAQARGDLLCPINDDVTFASRWDTTVREALMRTGAVACVDEYHEFPFVGRGWYSRLGYLAHDGETHVDSFIIDAAERAASLTKLPERVVYHERPDDQVHREAVSIIAEHRTSEEFWEPARTAWRIAAAEALRA